MFFFLISRLEREMKIYFWILPASHTYDFKKRVKNVLSMVFRNFPFNKIGSMGQNSGDFFHKILERKKKGRHFCVNHVGLWFCIVILSFFASSGKKKIQGLRKIPGGGGHLKVMWWIYSALLS